MPPTPSPSRSGDVGPIQIQPKAPCGLCSTPRHKLHTHTSSYSILFSDMLLPHKLLLILQNPAQISPSLRSLSSHLQTLREFVPLLEPLSNFSLCT